MDKKYLNTVLILSIVSIWGYIGWQLFGESTEPSSSYRPPSVHRKTKTPKELFIYDLLAENHKTTPFGRVASAWRSETVTKRKKKKAPLKKKAVTKKIVAWPDLVFEGLMASQSKVIALVKINNRSRMISEDNVVQNMTFSKINEDSLVIKLENETKTIYK